MTKIYFIIFLIIIALYDFDKHKIPNIIVIPGIVLGVGLTGHWIASVLAFMAAVVMSMWNPLTQRFAHDIETIEMKEGEHFIYGGDVKLLAMVAAFTGWKVVLITILSFILIKIFRKSTLFYGPLPMGPFVMASSMFFLW